MRLVDLILRVLSLIFLSLAGSHLLVFSVSLTTLSLSVVSIALLTLLAYFIVGKTTILFAIRGSVRKILKRLLYDGSATYTYNPNRLVDV